MNADSEFLKLARAMRFAQKVAEKTQLETDRITAANLEDKFDAALARMVKRQEPGLFTEEES